MRSRIIVEEEVCAITKPIVDFKGNAPRGVRDGMVFTPVGGVHVYAIDRPGFPPRSQYHYIMHGREYFRRENLARSEQALVREAIKFAKRCFANPNAPITEDD